MASLFVSLARAMHHAAQPYYQPCLHQRTTGSDELSWQCTVICFPFSPLQYDSIGRDSTRPFGHPSEALFCMTNGRTNTKCLSMQDGRRGDHLGRSDRPAGGRSAPRHPRETERQKVGPEVDGLGHRSWAEHAAAPPAGTPESTTEVSGAVALKSIVFLSNVVEL